MKLIKKLWFTDTRIHIETSAGRVLSQPLRYFPRLTNATESQRAVWNQSISGLHWPQLDEDISFESFSWGDHDPHPALWPMQHRGKHDGPGETALPAMRDLFCRSV